MYPGNLSMHYGGMRKSDKTRKKTIITLFQVMIFSNLLIVVRWVIHRWFKKFLNFQLDCQEDKLQLKKVPNPIHYQNSNKTHHPFKAASLRVREDIQLQTWLAKPTK